MGGLDPELDAPQEPYDGQYAVGYLTDRLHVEPSEGEWVDLFEAVEGWILNDPYLASHEVEAADWGGVRLLMTTEVPFFDAPPLVFYFTVDRERRVVEFRAVEDVGEVPDPSDFG